MLPFDFADLSQAVEDFNNGQPEDIARADKILTAFAALSPRKQCPLVDALINASNLNTARYGWHFFNKLASSIPRSYSEGEDMITDDLIHLLKRHYDSHLDDESISLMKADAVTHLYHHQRYNLENFIDSLSSPIPFNPYHVYHAVLIWSSYMRQWNTPLRKKFHKDEILKNILPHVDNLLNVLLRSYLLGQCERKEHLHVRNCEVELLGSSILIFTKALVDTMPSTEGVCMLRKYFDIYKGTCDLDLYKNDDSLNNVISKVLKSLIMMFSLRHKNIKDAFCNTTIVSKMGFVWSTIFYGSRRGLHCLVETAYSTITAYTELLVSHCKQRTVNEPWLALKWMESFFDLDEDNVHRIVELRCLKIMAECSASDGDLVGYHMLEEKLKSFVVPEDFSTSAVMIKPNILDNDDTDGWNTYYDSLRVAYEKPQIAKSLTEFLLEHFQAKMITYERWKNITTGLILDLNRIEKLFKVMMGRVNDDENYEMIQKMSQSLNVLIRHIFDRMPKCAPMLTDDIKLYSKTITHLMRIKTYFSFSRNDNYAGDVLCDFRLLFHILQKCDKQHFECITSAGNLLTLIFKSRTQLIVEKIKNGQVPSQVIHILAESCDAYPVIKRMPMIESVIIMAEQTQLEREYIDPLIQKVMAYQLHNDLPTMMRLWQFDIPIERATQKETRTDLHEFLIISRLLLIRVPLPDDVCDHIAYTILKALVVFNNWRQCAEIHRSYETGLTKAEKSIIDTADDEYEEEATSHGEGHPNTFFESMGDFLFLAMETLFDKNITMDWVVLCEACLPNISEMSLGGRKWYLKGYRLILKSAERNQLEWVWMKITGNFLRNAAKLVQTIEQMVSCREDFSDPKFLETLSCPRRLVTDMLACFYKCYCATENEETYNFLLLKLISVNSCRSDLFALLIQLLFLNDTDYRREVARILYTLIMHQAMIATAYRESKSNQTTEEEVQRYMVDFVAQLSDVVFQFAYSYICDNEDISSLKHVLSPFMKFLVIHTEPQRFCQRFPESMFPGRACEAERTDKWVTYIVSRIDELAKKEEEEEHMDIN